MNRISTVIVAKDNPLYIFKTIRSIENLSDEIIIVDIGIDAKVIDKLKKNKKVKIIKEKAVPYVELIREKVKDYAKNNYLFFLDPDEIVPLDLVKLIQENYLHYDYFEIPRKNIIFGKWIKYSLWWPDYQIRFFKKDHVIWSKQIHQQPAREGKGMVVDVKESLALLHYNYQSIDQYLEKMLRYAKSEGKYYTENNLRLDFKETIKKALHQFISRFFAYSGYKDGVRGFILAILQMLYYFIVYFYYLENKKFEMDKKEDLKKGAKTFFRRGLKETLYWTKKKSLVERIIKKLL